MVLENFQNRQLSTTVEYQHVYKKIIPEAVQSEILRLYGLGYPGKRIAPLFGLNSDSVMSVIRRLGVSRKGRSYPVNEHYFETIDTPEKAYFLGLMLSDGYNDEVRGKAEITLQSGDKDILERFSEAIFKGRPLQFKKGGFFRGRRTQDCWKLYLSNRTLSTDLARYEVKQAKSFTARMPSIRLDLIRHLVRGYFDGNGGFSARKNGFGVLHATARINGAKDLVTQISTFLCENCIKNTLSIVSGNSKEMAAIAIHSQNELLKLFDLLYRDIGDVCLRRKYLRFTAFFKIKKIKYEEHCSF